MSNGIFTIFRMYFEFSIHVTVLVNLAKYNVNFVNKLNQ